MITVAAICCFAGCAQKAEHKTVKEEKAASTTSDTTQYKSEPKGDIDVLKKSYPDWIKNGEVNYPYTLKSQELKAFCCNAFKASFGPFSLWKNSSNAVFTFR